MKLVLIGSGNTAHILGQKSVNAAHEVLQVYSRDPRHAADLALILKTESTSNPAQIIPGADLYLVAVKDEALYEVSSWLKLHTALVAHTAGTVTINTLKGVSSNFGVLYPLQSLRKEVYQMPQIPLLIDANTPGNLNILRNFGESISDIVVAADDDYRRKIHLAATSANNFTNYLFTLTENFCRSEKVDFRLLFPLIRETVDRLDQHSPADMQTGPAIRNDYATIDTHMKMLQGYPEFRTIYQLFTDQISNSAKNGLK
jgi:predicted short-subunit dehydrogenase-like oxidoreductase (DUF2520 family)